MPSDRLFHPYAPLRFQCHRGQKGLARHPCHVAKKILASRRRIGIFITAHVDMMDKQMRARVMARKQSGVHPLTQPTHHRRLFVDQFMGHRMGDLSEDQPCTGPERQALCQIKTVWARNAPDGGGQHAKMRQTQANQQSLAGWKLSLGVGVVGVCSDHAIHHGDKQRHVDHRPERPSAAGKHGRSNQKAGQDRDESKDQHVARPRFGGAHTPTPSRQSLALTGPDVALFPGRG